jgi:hypothetical protein
MIVLKNDCFEYFSPARKTPTPIRLKIEMDPTQNTQDHEMAPLIAGIGSHNPTPTTVGLPQPMGAPHLQQQQMGYTPMYGGPPQPMGYAHHGQMSMMNSQPMDYASVGGGYDWQGQPPYQQYRFGMQQQPPQMVVAPPAPAAYMDSTPPCGSPPVEHMRSTEGERCPSQTEGPLNACMRPQCVCVP